jgi:hypothetical protein
MLKVEMTSSELGVILTAPAAENLPINGRNYSHTKRQL